LLNKVLPLLHLLACLLFKRFQNSEKKSSLPKSSLDSNLLLQIG